MHDEPVPKRSSKPKKPRDVNEMAASSVAAATAEEPEEKAEPMPEDAAHMAAVAELAHHHGLSVHLDGARIFNAALALETSASRNAAHADTVSFCLSKGLACPAGTMLCGPRPFVERARRLRKMLGGGMRQAGIIAAAGIVALTV